MKNESLQKTKVLYITKMKVSFTEKKVSYFKGSIYYISK